MKILQEDEILI